MNDIYNVAKAHLGKHLTLNNAVSDEVGCAESVSFCLLNAGFNIPIGGLASVNGLIAWLLANGFKEVENPQIGAIITAHNPDPTDINFAHTGICGKYGIMSNTSSNGIFAENYSYSNWDSYFSSNGSKTRYFSSSK